MFNGGLVGVNPDGRKVMQYWKEACAWKCERTETKGLYGDQKYFDVVPIMFGDVCKIIQHRGCNVAEWNRILNQHVEQEDGSVLINNKWPITFVHLTEFWAECPTLGKYVENRNKDIKFWRRWVAKHRR